MPNEPSLPIGTLVSFLLVFVRMLGIFVLVPMPIARTGPPAARLVFALCFTVALFPLWPAPPASPPSVGLMALWMISETGFGLTVGLAVGFLIETFLLAAHFIGAQAGYTYASMVDPSTQADSNVFQVFAQLWAGLLFFSLGLDRQALRVFAKSLEAYPPGTYTINMSSAEAIIQLGSAMFSTALRLALPVIALLLLIDISLALFGRIQPALQLISLAFPAKMLAALLMLATISALFLPVFRSAAEETFSMLDGWLGANVR